MRVFGETKVERRNNRKLREFKLGQKEVPEKHEKIHEHLCVVHFDDDSITVSRKSRRERTLNITSGLALENVG